MLLARKSVLQRSDLGPGWTQTGSKRLPGEVPACPGYRPDFSKFTIVGQAGTQFTSWGVTSINSSVEVLATRAQARKELAMAMAPAFSRCLTMILRRQMAAAPGVSAVGLVSAGRLGLPALGERSWGYRIVLTVTRHGRTLPVYLDLVAILRARSVAGLLFSGIGEPVPGQRRILARAVARLR